MVVKWQFNSITAQKTKLSIEDFCSKCERIRKNTADLVTFTEEILNEKLHFLCNTRGVLRTSNSFLRKYLTALMKLFCENC